jgi:hypothetical protein
MASARGVALNSSTEHHQQRGRQQNHLQSSGYTSLHQHLDGNSGKGVLTGAEVSSVMALGVEVVKQLQDG